MSNELVISVIDALEAEQVPYIFAGSFASMVYGIPRSTKDVDFVIELEERTFRLLIDRLDPLFELDPQQHLETLTWTRRYILSARKAPFKVELFLQSEDPHHVEQWSRKRSLLSPIINRSVWMPTAEDVVIQKIRGGRPRDKVDAGDVISVQGDHLDWPYIERWCDVHQTRQVLAEILATVPPRLRHG